MNARAILIIALMAAAPFSMCGRAAENEDEVRLRSAHLTVNTQVLLEFFKKRSEIAPDANEIAQLSEQLGQRAIREYESAMGGFVRLGPVAIPALRALSREAGHAGQRAKECIEIIETQSSDLALAALRILSEQQPEGTTEVLLHYLPFADNDLIISEVQQTLFAIAGKEGKCGPALLKALEDPAPLRRAAAVELIMALGPDEARELCRGLLKDPRPQVRLRVALSRAGQQDEEALLELFNLLAELPREPAWEVEEFLMEIAGRDAPKVSLADGSHAGMKSRDAWLDWWKRHDANHLLEELKKRTMTPQLRQQLETWIKDLGSETYEERRTASSELIRRGTLAKGFLNRHRNDPDAEVRRAVQNCLEIIDNEGPSTIPSLVTKLLAYRRPDGTVETLLDYVPDAEDAITVEHIIHTLRAIARNVSPIHPQLLAALEDRDSGRRAVVGRALSGIEREDVRASVRKLLKDPVLEVKSQIAQELVRVGDREAMPVLIALLADLKYPEAMEVEEQLLSLAGATAPSERVAEAAESRKKAGTAWATWWNDNAQRVALHRNELRPRMLGHTLLVQFNQQCVREIDRAGRELWKIDSLQYPVDACVLSNNRVLIVEGGNYSVSERDFTGKVIWQTRMTSYPVNVQRLVNGNTFVACQGNLVELDRQGKEVRNIPRPQHDVQTALKNRDGRIFCATRQGRLERLDADGKVLNSVDVGRIDYTSGMDLLKNGNVLLPLFNQSKVCEFDSQGKIVWQAASMAPNSATRLSNGHTLVASNQSMVKEYDRTGKLVGEIKHPAWRARRR